MQKMLNMKLAELPDNSILGAVHIEHLSFGSAPPEITLLDCTDPFPEFYANVENEQDELIEGATRCTDSTLDECYEGDFWLEETSQNRLNENPINYEYKAFQSFKSKNSGLNTPNECDNDKSRKNHIQFKFNVRYSGDLCISINTEAKLNYPYDDFLRLPIQLSITEVIFSGTLMQLML